MNLAFAHLMPLLRDVEHAGQMSLADWDGTLRLARQARLLGLIGHRLFAHPSLWNTLPTQVQGQLRAAMNYSAHRRQLVEMELLALDAALPSDTRVILLKGAAYIAQSLPFSHGRLPNDIDLLVQRGDIDAVESTLLKAGWKSEVTNTYDQRYYRELSHELPPMRHPGHALEVDLHHTIAPVTSRTRANDPLLFADLVPLTGSRFFVLDPRDQVIHASIHLFQDSELDGRLRDLVDIDGLLRHHLQREADWSTLLARADRHGASRILWYALHFCRSWLGTPIPHRQWPPSPGWASRSAMEWLLPRSCLPCLPDRSPSLDERLATHLASIRYHVLRMPPGLLMRHFAHKIWRAVPRRLSPKGDAAG